MKTHIIKNLCGAIVAVCCIVMSVTTVYADDAKPQTEQPMTLEIQLGQQWAGSQFRLKTDSELQSKTITVDEDGVLRTEISSSKYYILSYLKPLGESSPAQPTSSGFESGDESVSTIADTSGPKADSVAGIPIKHIIVFSCGMLLAIGGLITLHVIKKRRDSGGYTEGCDDEDDY